MQINDLSRCINRWPAVIFAINRTDKVIGRIKFLIISIKTIKGIKGIGDPIGTIWARRLLVFLIEKNIKFPNHIDKAIGRIIDIWAVRANEDGIIVIKFISKIDKNKGDKKLLFKFLLVKVLNSFDKFIIIFFNKMLILVILLKIGKNKIIIVINHLELIKKLHGSNIENRLVII